MISPNKPEGFPLSYIEVAAQPSTEKSTSGKESRIPGNKAFWVGIFAEFRDEAFIKIPISLALSSVLFAATLVTYSKFAPLCAP
jgi:hypothetical protein